MERPVKKPRLQGPDGFQKSKLTTRYRPPESITKFVSAFDDVGSPAKQDQSPTKKTGNERPRNPFVDFDVPRQPQPEAGPSKLPTSKPLSSARPRPVKADNKEMSSLKVLKPPVFLPPPAPRTTHVEPKKPLGTAGTSLCALHRLIVPPDKPRSILKPPPPPPPSPGSSTHKPHVQLRPLAPPPHPVALPTSPQKPMKTIRTTTIAQAIDPTKEGAGAELLSLYLQQHGHGYTSSTDRELQRGVTVSPDKRSRGRDPRFVRGGLAERFQHRIACAKTDFTLWRRQMEQKMASGTKIAPDMQLHILRVLDVSKPPSPSSRTPNGPRAGLALCRLARRHPLARDLTLGTYVVVFHFAPTEAGSKSAVSSADRFQDGDDAMVWMPWHRVGMAGIPESKRLWNLCQQLEPLTPPNNLLVVSRFCVVAPRVGGVI